MPGCYGPGVGQGRAVPNEKRAIRTLERRGTMMRCLDCDEEMVQRSRRETLHGFSSEIETHVCLRCGEEWFSASSLNVYEIHAAIDALQSWCLIDRTALKFGRKALGLTTNEIGQLVGCASTSIVRWEHAVEVGDRPARYYVLALYALLRLAADGHDVHAELR